MPLRGKRGRRAEPQPQAPGAYAAALKAGFESTSTQVQQMHQAIADQAFATLQHIPGLSTPARWVQVAHDAISGGVHAAVRHGGGAALTVAGLAEQSLSDPGRVPGRREQVLRGVLNGVAGDALQADGNPLAVRMGLHAGGRPLPVTPEALAALGERLCVFIHGLACDEHSWGTHHAEGVVRDFGASVVFVRYNSGLSIADNGQALSDLLGQLALHAPAHVRDVVLVGHSMGGLVARAAAERAQLSDAAWLVRTRMLVCLGTPHLGAPLERAGHVLSTVLGWSAMTRPLSRLADARSRGIQDLRDGAPATGLPLPLRLVVGLDDRLVRSGSAGARGLQGDVERVELAGLGHMDLLDHPQAYAAMHRWLRRLWP